MLSDDLIRRTRTGQQLPLNNWYRNPGAALSSRSRPSVLTFPLAGTWVARNERTID